MKNGDLPNVVQYLGKDPLLNEATYLWDFYKTSTTMEGFCPVEHDETHIPYSHLDPLLEHPTQRPTDGQDGRVFNLYDQKYNTNVGIPSIIPKNSEKLQKDAKQYGENCRAQCTQGKELPEMTEEERNAWDLCVNRCSQEGDINRNDNQKKAISEVFRANPLSKWSGSTNDVAPIRMYHGTQATDIWDQIAAGNKRPACFALRANHGQGMYLTANPVSAYHYSFSLQDSEQRKGYVVLLEIDGNCKNWDGLYEKQYIFVRPADRTKEEECKRALKNGADLPDHCACPCNPRVVQIFERPACNLNDDCPSFFERTQPSGSRNAFINLFGSVHKSPRTHGNQQVLSPSY